MSQDESSSPTRAKRERSPQYPGVPLADSIELCKFIESRGLDGLTAGDVATALGYKNIKTNTFSARLSAARQFGLLMLKDEGYSLTPLAKAILHPVDLDEVAKLHRQAMLEPPLYAKLAEQFGDKKLPDAGILGNVLYHQYQIIVSAKQGAADAFLESARFAGALGEDHVFRPNGPTNHQPPATSNGHVPLTSNPAPASIPLALPEPDLPRVARSGDVRIDLRLWGPDAGKAIRMRIPESITPESFERLLQSIRLHVRIEDATEGDEEA